MLPCNDSLLFVSGHRKNAEDAMQSLNGAVIGKQTVRLSWGRSPASKQVILLNIVQVFYIGWIISWVVETSQYDSICILQIPTTPPKKKSLSLFWLSSGTEVYSFFFLKTWQWRDHSNQWNGTQNGGQGYGGYGYAVPQTQGLGMYATAAVHGAS